MQVSDISIIYLLFSNMPIVDDRKARRNVHQPGESSAVDIIIRDMQNKQQIFSEYLQEFHPTDLNEEGEFIFPPSSDHVKAFFASMMKFAHTRLKCGDGR